MAFNVSDAQSAPRYVGLSSFFRAAYLPESLQWVKTSIDIGLVGVPFDGGTTDQPGARRGPGAIRNATTRFGVWNQELNRAPFELGNIADIGDVWPRNPFHLEHALNEIETCFDTIIEEGIRPLSVGGDHSISFPILCALGRSNPLGLIHIDAHCDTGNGYMGSKFHHGAPFARAVEAGVLDPKRCTQIGIRGPLNSDVWKFSRDSGMRVITMDEFCQRGVNDVMQEAIDRLGNGPSYLSFDIDALDPAFAPDTGTPVDGGFTSREAIQMIRALDGVYFVGGDLVEVSPPANGADNTSRLAARLLFEMLCVFAGPEGKFMRYANRNTHMEDSL